MIPIPIETHGWIPNLTANILLKDKYSKLEPINEEIISKISNQLIKTEIQDIAYPVKLYAYVSLADDGPISSDITSIHDEYPNLFIYIGEHRLQPEKIFVFEINDGKFDHISTSLITDLDPKGWITFNTKITKPLLTSTEKLKTEYLNQIFIQIREFYSENAHHFAVNDGNEADYLSAPAHAQTKTDSMKCVLNYYLEKISYYHEEHNKMRSKGMEFQIALQSLSHFRRQAKGCFLYGSNFLEFYGEDFLDSEERDVNRHVFQNAIELMEAFTEEIQNEYTLESTETLQTVALLTAFLTGFIVLITLIESYISQDYLITIFTVTFLVAVLAVIIRRIPNI